MSILVVDDDLDPVPVGESGEIVVRSEFLSPGYWQNADLTAKAFVVDPKDGTRLYRTGDLGRLNPEGLLEHLGRKDFRVKIRGLTIEVAEIEAVLGKSPDVRDVRVVARDFGEGDERLVAFVVCKDGASPSDGALRELVRQSLPDYMSPAMFVMLDALPLTTTGKLDHKVLTSMPIQFPESDGETGSSDSVEARLVHIWREVLRVPAVNLDDSFFELGGHSLLAMNMLARVEKEFGCQLAASVMAQHPTVRGLADTIRGGGPSPTTAMIVPYRAVGNRPPIFCIAPSYALHFMALATALGPEQPLFGVQPPHADGFRVPGVTVEYMARLYADEIARNCLSGPLHLVGFCGGGVIAFEVAQLLLSRGREIGVLALLDTPRDFDRLRERPIGALRYYARRAVHHPRVAFSLPLAGGVRYLADRLLHMVRSVVATTPEDADRLELSPEAWRALAENRDAFARYPTATIPPRPRPHPRRRLVFGVPRRPSPRVARTRRRREPGSLGPGWTPWLPARAACRNPQVPPRGRHLPCPAPHIALQATCSQRPHSMSASPGPRVVPTLAEVHIWTVRHDRISSRDDARRASVLSEAEVARFSRSRSASHRACQTRARGALRHILASYLATKPGAHRDRCEQVWQATRHRNRLQLFALRPAHARGRRRARSGRGRGAP